VRYFVWDGPAVETCAITLESTTGAEPPPLARKPNYGFEKRKKELDRKARKDAKREDRQRRDKEQADGSGATQPPAEGEERGDSGADVPPA
jgi:hypothetical protein